MKGKGNMRKSKLIKSLGYLSLLTSTAVYAEEVMVITASGFEQEIQNAPASISVITAEEIQNKSYRDVTDALKDIPGVNITGGAGSSDISIRGMAAKYTLILIDGKRMRTRETRPNSDGPGIEQGWLPPLSAIERIEVVRGPMSSLYGSDAMGGVINIITRKVSDEWQGNLRLESTFQENSKSSNPHTAGFSLTGPLIEKVLGLQLYGQYSKRKEDEYIGGYPEQKLRSLNGKLSFVATEDQSFELDLGRTLQSKLGTQGNTIKVTARSKDSEHESQRNYSALTHNGNWGWSTSKTSVAYESTNNTTRRMKIDNTDFDTQFLIPINDHMLTLGGKYSYQKLNDQGNKFKLNRISELDRWDYALFVEDEWQVLDNLSFTAGLRFNKDELYGKNWSPRIYSVWSIDENFSLKGGISRGYSTPGLRQVVSDWGQATGGSGGNGVIVGNPDLSPEKSANYEVSLGYTNEDGVSASATAFYTRFKNKIESYYLCARGTPGGCSLNGETFEFTQKWHNVDKADIKGLELTAKAPLFERFVVTSSYTWMETEQKSGPNKGNPLNRLPRHKFNLQLDWHAMERLELWGKVGYYGEETAVGRNSGTKYPGYTQWDLGGSWAINRNTKVYSGVYNLFDKRIINDDFGKTLDGRRYWLGVDVGF